MKLITILKQVLKEYFDIETGDQYKDIDAKLESYFEKFAPGHMWKDQKRYFFKMINDKKIYGNNPYDPKFYDAYVKLVNDFMVRKNK